MTFGNFMDVNFQNLIQFLAFQKHPTYCGQETWSVTLKERQRLKKFVTKMLRRMFWC